MKKIIYPSAHEALAASAALVTLVENATHVKSAASSAITRQMLEECKPDKDHFLLHVVGLGDYETFGMNSNADAFPKSANIKYHHTFVKHGAYYKEHRHNDYRKESIGEIKMAVHNDAMSRVELAVWGRIRPMEGFEKTAEEQYQKLRDGESLAVSMSCRVPNDRANCCGNIAPSTAQYCDHMKHSPGQYIPELRKFAFVFNDEPTFFDISDVARPADRTARQIEAVFHKAASAKVAYSADLAAAEGVNIPDATPAFATDLRKRALLDRLVGLAKHADLRLLPSDLREFDRVVVKRAFEASVDQSQVDALAAERPEDLFRKLASHFTVLPLDAFLALFDGSGRRVDEIRKSADYRTVKASLKTALEDLPENGMVDIEPLFSCGHALVNGPEDVDRVIEELAGTFGLATPSVERRVVTTIAISGVPDDEEEDDTPDDTVKEASTYDAGHMAKTYWIYKVAALDAIRGYHGSHAIDDRTLMLALGLG